ncbi:recombinase family protein [Luteimonas sp. RC10]|uniref:recombinase family protein n=1 Tax=Luteimonas sp. RC10 TaxID=2587035 RepID=UPI001616FB2E|nr:recombinase family protein [Luteimonas sp. RC10]MBB3342168.1 DNA invertase Pin-like site-specific DNA recombinase [Luteimonas sp. RC10]
MRFLGYARVSTDEQNVSLQLNALKAAGCSEIFTDEGISGGQRSRPGLENLLSTAQPGDTLVVWRLDRLGRSLTHLVELLADLGQRDIRFRSLCEYIDTASSGGRLVFHMMAALSEFERSLISERTRAGMAAARAKGRHLGRASALSPAQREEARKLVQCEHLPHRDVAQRFNVHPRTIARLIARDSGDG